MLLSLAASTDEIRPSPSASSLVNAADEVSIVATFVLVVDVVEDVVLLDSGAGVCANAAVLSNATALMTKVFISISSCGAKRL